jgi:general secretion pathway protein K
MRYYLKKTSKQRGIVIIVALFIVALAAAMACAMILRAERDTRRMSLLLHATQAELYAEGSLAWAKDTLKTNWETRQTKHLVDQMLIRAKPIITNGYVISSEIEDMQSRFNINEILNKNGTEIFKRLLTVLVPKMPMEAREQLTEAIIDWETPGGHNNALKQYYLERPVPYRAAHRPLFLLSELRLVKGMAPEIYQVLRPVMTALPSPALINVQTAPVPVLMSLSPAMTLDAAKALVKLRSTTPITDKEQFENLDLVRNFHLETAEDNITFVSQYFLLTTEVKIDGQDIFYYTLLQRIVKENKAIINVLWQSQGIS